MQGDGYAGVGLALADERLQQRGWAGRAMFTAKDGTEEMAIPFLPLVMTCRSDLVKTRTVSALRWVMATFTFGGLGARVPGSS